MEQAVLWTVGAAKRVWVQGLYWLLEAQNSAVYKTYNIQLLDRQNATAAGCNQKKQRPLFQAT